MGNCKNPTDSDQSLLDRAIGLPATAGGNPADTKKRPKPAPSPRTVFAGNATQDCAARDALANGPLSRRRGGAARGASFSIADLSRPAWPPRVVRLNPARVRCVDAADSYCCTGLPQTPRDFGNRPHEPPGRGNGLGLIASGAAIGCERAKMRWNWFWPEGSGPRTVASLP